MEGVHFAIEQHQLLPFVFCSYGLEKNFQPNVYEDFEKLTLEFYRNGDLYGLEKYWYVLSFYLFAFLFCETVAGDYLFIFSEGTFCC